MKKLTLTMMAIGEGVTLFLGTTVILYALGYFIGQGLRYLDYYQFIKPIIPFVTTAAAIVLATSCSVLAIFSIAQGKTISLLFDNQNEKIHELSR